MHSQNDIEEQLSDLSNLTKFINRKEFKELPGIISNGEKVMYFIPGMYNLKQGALVVTSERLLFIHKGFTGKVSVIEFKYDLVTHFNYELGIISGKITFSYQDNPIKLYNLEKPNFQRTIEYINKKIPSTVLCENTQTNQLKNHTNNGYSTKSNNQSTMPPMENNEIKEEDPPTILTDVPNIEHPNTIETNTFYPVSDFVMKSRPEIVRKVESWIGLKPLDNEQKSFFKREKIKLLITSLIFFVIICIIVLTYMNGTSKGIFVSLMLFGMIVCALVKFQKRFRDDLNQQELNTDIIYQRCLRYWNKELVHHLPRYGPGTNVTSKFQKIGFEVDNKLKITQLNYFNMIPIDMICYVRCESKDKSKTNIRENSLGIYFRLNCPENVAVNVNPFILVPVGNKVRDKKYKWKKRIGEHDLYIKKAFPSIHLEEILELLEPLIRIDIPFSVKYNTDIEVYIPDFLPVQKSIKTKEEVSIICEKVDFWFDFYERSLEWRYGKLPEDWEKGKENTLAQ